MKKPKYYQIVCYYCDRWAGVMEHCDTKAEAEARSRYYNDIYNPDDDRVEYVAEAVYPNTKTHR